MGAEGIPPVPSQETQEGGEVSLEHVLAELNKNGAEHPETLELVVAWTISREKAVDAGPTETRSWRAVLFNLERAQLYVAAGDLAEANSCLHEARYQAEQEDMQDLLARADAELALLNGPSN